MPDELTQDAASYTRLDGVFRRWRRAERRNLPVHWWTRSPRDSLGRSCLLVSILLMPLAARIGSHLLAAESALAQARAVRPAVVIAALALLALVHGWQVDRLIVRNSNAEPSTVPWLRGLRRLLASVPIVGWLVLPWWRHLEETRPSWAFRITPLPLCLLSCTSRVRGARYRRRSPSGYDFPERRSVVLVAVSVALLSLAVSPLLATVERAMATTTTRSLAVAVHLTGLACALVRSRLDVAQSEIARNESLWRALAAMFWLVPVPLAPILTLIPYLFENDSAPRASTLVAKAASARTGVGRFSEWSLLRNGLRTGWGGLHWARRLRGRSPELDAIGEAGTIEQKVARLSRVKAAGLFCDGACLSFSLLWLGHLNGWASMARAVLGLVALVGLALGIAGMAAMAWTFTAALLRRRHSLPRYLRGSLPVLTASTQLGFFFGLFFGEGLYRRHAGQVGGVLLAVGMVGAMIQVLPPLLSLVLDLPAENERQDRARTWWSIGFSLLGLQGLAITWLGPTALPSSRYSLAIIASGSLISMGIGWHEREWLLHPYEWRDGLGSAAPRLRRLLLVLAFTAIVPCGGLAVPLWNFHRTGPPLRTINGVERR